MPPEPAIHRFRVPLPHGVDLECRANEPGDTLRPDPPRAGRPTVLFLHGFPEAAFVWDGLLRALVPQARCVAPNLRGYGGSSAPEDIKSYRPRHLVQDVAALIEQLGAPIDLLVAHDWGGAVAWNLAAERPDLLRRLMILNAPHPATFLKALRHDPAQQQASAYMNFLCRPDAEALLAEDDFRRLWPFFTNMGATDSGHPGGGWLTQSTREQYREVWRQGLRGPLNYYRASPLRPATSPEDALHRLELPDEAVTVRVPTLVLWGDGDTALRPSLLEGLGRYVPHLRLVQVPGATHWIVHEQPELVAEHIQVALAQATA